MTEKRFTVDDGLEDVLCWEINDKENEDMTCGECAKLLNELHEENEQLKFELKECQEHKLFSRRELEKENEQLKSEIKDFQELLTGKEEELLKPIRLTIQEAYETERTSIGKSVLRQLLETIQ